MPTKTTSGGGSTDVEGTGSKAKGVNSRAEGKSTSASAAGAHAEGTSTIASGANSHAEGQSNTASGTYSHAEGSFTSATGSNSHAEGSSCIATGVASHAQGVSGRALRKSQHAHGGGQVASAGDVQASTLVYSAITTNATPRMVAYLDEQAATFSGEDINVLHITASRAYRFRIDAVARNTGADEFGGWTITGTIVRHSSGSARFISTPTVVADLDAAAAAWTLAVSIDTTNATNNYLRLTATGEAAKTIRWVAQVEFTEAG